MSLEINNNHAADGLLKFAAPFWGKPRWAALYVAIARQIQEVEAMLFDVIEKRMLDNATGAQLRVLGRLVGQTDPGLGEAVFKSLIRVRIRINRSLGRRKDLLEVLQLLGIPASQRQLTPSYPAKTRLDLWGTLPLPLELMLPLLQDVMAAGVGLIVLYTDGVDAFAFSDDTAVVSSSTEWADEAVGGDVWAAVW
jgi:hypothetical protein